MKKDHGEISWTELMTKDVNTAREFYASLCGWEYDSMQMSHGTYTLAKVNGVPTAAIFDMSGQPEFDNIPDHWFNYLAVDDVDKAVDTTIESGGKVLKGPFDVPGAGRMAVIEDAVGAAIGLFQVKSSGQES